MRARFCIILIGLPSLLLFIGCSTPESQERLSTILCWLRPSCLPSQPRIAKIPSPPTTTKPSPTPLPVKPQPPVSAQKPPSTRCMTSAKATIHASKPSITVSYVEPTTKANGQALTNLAKTTIYQDLGKGFVKYKDIPATNPQGGGTIQEKISFKLNEGNTIHATICVTATDTNGREG